LSGTRRAGELETEKSVPLVSVALLTISAVFVLILACLVGIGTRAKKSEPTVELPQSVSQFKEKEQLCLNFLSQIGKKRAKNADKPVPFYSVKAKLDEKEKKIRCKLNLLFPNTTGSDLKELALIVYPNRSSSSTRDNVWINSASINGRATRFTLEKETLFLKPSFNLKRAESYLVKLDLTERIPPIGAPATGDENEEAGMGIFGYKGDVFNLGYFIPAIAKFEKGRWQIRNVPAFADRTPSLCAHYLVYLDVPEGFTVLASGSEFSKKEVAGRMLYGFAAGMSRDFGAQVAKNRFIAEKEAGETKIKISVSADRKDAASKLADFSLSAIKEYRLKFGGLPYGNITLCEAPLSGNAGGMEFTGLVFINSSLLPSKGKKEKSLYEELKRSLPEDFESLFGEISGNIMLDTLEFVIAHEICHQWFGISVGSDPVIHPWQDESLVNYLAAKYFYLKYGKDKGDGIFEQQILAPYRISLMGGMRSLPVDSPAYEFTSTVQYTAIIYCKGAIFFDELEKKMGEKNLFKALSVYYRDFTFKQAESDDLVNSLRKEAKDAQEFDSLYKSWIKEAKTEEALPPFSDSFERLNEFFEKFKEEWEFDLGPLEKMFEDMFDKFFNKPPDSEKREEEPMYEPEKGSPLI